ncbi:cell division protein ZapE [Subtercola boreus]|uniref:Cell division protein ZapE n=1 Tax=Subtercola boreus TaxID=120213 RepID=A0A3E0WC39_9MICO|nr:cell division protein ZapE [Subtercola boreus]RFA20856.1 cell division protein ZapE [Subtercola boreus]RFA20972.1 cell division protein ZapE [Subtercola boreus]RFA27049.1 cell division protein ZapE [Subtercola boreus]
MTTDSGSTTIPLRLVDLRPTLSGPEMAAVLVPPRQFDTASFDSYRPDRDYPSQGETLHRVRDFSQSFSQAKSGGFFSRAKKRPASKPGIYLDGGFGVGKTHLLAALWHAAPAPKFFGTFIEFTALVGALGYLDTVKLLQGSKLIAIDEFELDDPGDTMMMTRLLGDLVASGTKIAATSNTPPNALGEGRFAAQDFLREIQALADRFDIIRIDGIDYRRRDIEGHAATLDGAELEQGIDRMTAAGERFTTDDFTEVIQYLGSLHPSKYVKLLTGLDALVLTDVVPLTNQTDALRFVAFIDRVYDAQLPILATGAPLDSVFAGDMMNGGYRKKYLRSVSRLIASSQR